MQQLWPVSMAIALAMSLCAAAIAGAAEPALFAEPNRPQFHFTPERNWMNDPNGLVYFEGQWHLFHQYNPQGNDWGHMSWGHAVSGDLVHWKHLPVALREEDGVMIFSGSAVVDHHNTSGFGSADHPPLVAIYTGHGHEKQTQNIAYSTDRGLTWTKFAGNPVIDENLKDFRDPKVFWHEPGKRWVMVVAVSDRHQVRCYGSADLKKWELLGDFGGQGATGGAWECPDLFELPALNGPRWVLSVNVSGGAPAGGSGCQYFIGHFDGKTFHNDNAKETALWADYGPDFYAAQSWSDVPVMEGRRIWIGWMTDLRYAGMQPTKPWRSALSLPRRLGLIETRDGVRLMQLPIKELSALSPRRIDPESYTTAGQMLQIDAGLDPAADARISVCGDGQEHETVIGYDAAQSQLYVDRTRSRPGEPFQKDFPARFTVPITPLLRRQIDLCIFVDRSSVEVFANQGASVITATTFPAKDANRLRVEGAVTRLEAYALESIWNNKE